MEGIYLSHGIFISIRETKLNNKSLNMATKIAPFKLYLHIYSLGMLKVSDPIDVGS